MTSFLLILCMHFRLLLPFLRLLPPPIFPCLSPKLYPPLFNIMLLHPGPARATSSFSCTATTSESHFSFSLFTFLVDLLQHGLFHPCFCRFNLSGKEQQARSDKFHSWPWLLTTRTSRRLQSFLDGSSNSPEKKTHPPKSLTQAQLAGRPRKAATMKWMWKKKFQNFQRSLHL